MGGFCLFLFLLPFIWWPWAEIAFEIPRVWYFLVGIDLFSLVLSAILVRTISIFNHIRIFRYIGLFFGIIIFASLFGVDPAKSIWGNRWRLDGVVTLVHLGVFSVLIASIGIERIRQVGLVMGASALVFSGYVGLLWVGFLAGFPVPNVAGAIGGTFGQPNFLAGYVAVSLPLATYFLRLLSGRFGAAVNILMVLPVAALLASGSLGGIAGLLVFLLLNIYESVPKRMRPVKTFLIILAAAGVIGLAGYSVWSASRLPQHVLAESRVRIFTKGFLAWTQKPFLGWGWANFDHAFAAVDWPYHFRYDAYVDKAHSHLVEVLVTTGILGLASYLAALSVLVKSLRSQIPGDGTGFATVLLWTFILFLFHSQSNVISIAEEVVFWFVVGDSAGLLNAEEATDSG
jgi:O-antigen ligase